MYHQPGRHPGSPDLARFQWNAVGSEFTELNFGGTGTNDNNGAPGDSRTGGHHIMGVAEGCHQFS